MSQTDQPFNGRTNLRRRLSYERYVRSFRLTMGFFLLVQIVPFAMVLSSSIQLHLRHYAVASCVVIATLVLSAVLIEIMHLRPLHGCFCEINGSEVTGKMNRSDVVFSFSDIANCELSDHVLLGQLFVIVLKNGTRLRVKFGLERFDYLIDSLIGYRPDFQTPEFRSPGYSIDDSTPNR